MRLRPLEQRTTSRVEGSGVIVKLSTVREAHLGRFRLTIMPFASLQGYCQRIMLFFDRRHY